jgi:hypothetical protein
MPVVARVRRRRRGRASTAARRRHLIASRRGIGGVARGREGGAGKWRGDRVRIRMRMPRSSRALEAAAGGAGAGAGGRAGVGWCAVCLVVEGRNCEGMDECHHRPC